jgi:hypothetical protein
MFCIVLHLTLFLHCEFESCSWWGELIQHYVIKFVSDLRQVNGLLQFPPPLKLTATIELKNCWRWHQTQPCPPPPFHTPYRFVIFLLIVHVLFLPILSIPNRQKMCTLWSLWMTFPLCKYFVAFNNWYMIYLLWTSFNIFPLFITLW